MARDPILSFRPVDPESASGDIREILEKAGGQAGFVPNVYKNMANLPPLLDTYLHGYRAFREQTGLSPAEQEVVFLTASREHGCDYCVAAHSMVATKKAGLPAEVVEALRAGKPAPDPKLAALSRFTSHMVATRGNPTREEVDRFLAAGYEERHVLAIVLAIAVKVLTNYTNHLFHTELDDVFAEFEWSG